MQTFSDFLIYFLFIGIFLIYFFSKEAKKRVFKSKKSIEKKAVSFSKNQNISSFPPLKKVLEEEEEPKKKSKIKKSILKSKIKAKNLKDLVILSEIFQKPDY